MALEGYSMVGGSIEVGIRRWDRQATVTWYSMDQGTTTISVQYEIEDWDRVLRDAFSGFFDGADPICPWCEARDDWSVSLDTDGIFSDDAEGRALAEIYTPCEDHAKTAEGKSLGIEFGLGEWIWHEDRWMSPPILNPLEGIEP